MLLRLKILLFYLIDAIVLILQEEITSYYIQQLQWSIKNLIFSIKGYHIIDSNKDNAANLRNISAKIHSQKNGLKATELIKKHSYTNLVF